MSFPNCLMNSQQNEGTLIIYDNIIEEYKFLYDYAYNGEVFLTNHKEIEETINKNGIRLKNCCIVKEPPVYIYWVEA